jgi:adenylate cyclase
MENETSDSKLKIWRETGLRYWRQIPTVLKALATLVIALNAAWQLYTRVLSPSEIASTSKSDYSKTEKMGLERKEKETLSTSDKPTIAVLAFENMSNDPKQDYLADGFAEEIINGLSKCPHIVVIARNSSFIYKGKPVKVQQIAEELGVRNVLEGSFRKTGNKVRITVQLIDAQTGRHLFSERYDREMKDILETLDAITMKILDAVQVKLTAGEDARLRSKGTKNLDAYLKLMQARQCMQYHNKEGQALARQMIEEAIAMDPGYGAAYTALCKVQLLQVALGVYKNSQEVLQQAIVLGQKGISLDDSNSLAHATVAATYAWLRENDKAISEAEKAVSLDPNSAYAYHVLGSVLNWAGRSQEAIPYFKMSLRLSPIPIDTTTLILMGTTYRNLGQYEEALGCYKKSLQLYGNDHMGSHLGLTAVYAMMGRDKEAQAEAAEVLRLDPKFSGESYVRRLPLKDQKSIDDLISAYRRAGLK